MKRLFSLFALMLVVGTIVPMGAGVVQAQENSTANETTETTTAVEQDDVNRTMRIDSATTITDWYYDENTQEFVLTVEADIPQTITMAESIPLGEGMRSAGIKQTQLYTGENTVRAPAQKHEGVAVISVTTQRSISENRQIIIQSGQMNNNPLSSLGGTSGVFTGILSALTVSLLSAWFVVWRDSDGVEVAD
jgi:hypothetical protein